MSLVKLTRLGQSLDDYSLVIKGDHPAIIRIRDRNDLVELYKQSHRQSIDDAPVTWSIAGSTYTFAGEVKRWIFGTVESWFWDYARSAS